MAFQVSVYCDGVCTCVVSPSKDSYTITGETGLSVHNVELIE